MNLVIYIFFLFLFNSLKLFPIWLLAKIGEVLGIIYFYLDFKHRKLAINNLSLAFPEKSKKEILSLARNNFKSISSNLLLGVKLSSMPSKKVDNLIDIIGSEIPKNIISKGQGYIAVLTHSSCWELFSQSEKVKFGKTVGSLYQSLNNKYIDNFVKKLRSSKGVLLFDRKDGFFSTISFLKDGGGLGILCDQHAGDGGVWTPFFDRLASTTNLPILLAKKAKVSIVPVSLITKIRKDKTNNIKKRWVIKFHEPINFHDKRNDSKSNTGQLVADLNLKIESIIRESPSDWFWVHNRWKTPKPNFLLKNYKRGVYFPKSASSNKNNLKKFNIIVRTPNWLGDACMATPAVRAIKNGRPDCELTVLCPDKLSDYWKQINEVDRIIVRKNGESVFSVAKKVRNELNNRNNENKKNLPIYYDAGIVLPNSHRSILELWFGRCKRIVAYPRKGRSLFADQLVQFKGKMKKYSFAENKNIHHSEHYNLLVKNIGGNLDSVEEKSIDLVSKSKISNIGICAGAEYGSAKRWGAENFAQTINLVSKSKTHKINWSFFGVNSDLAIYNHIESILDKSLVSYKNLCGKTLLNELINELKKCDLLLTNDTGTMHLAASLGISTVSIFGSTDPNWTSALGGKDTVVYKKVDCSPCFLRDCPIDFRCMKSISPKEVSEIILDKLNKNLK